MIECPLPRDKTIPDIVSISNGACDKIENAITIEKPKNSRGDTMGKK